MIPAFIENSSVNQIIQIILLIGSAYFMCLLLENIYILFQKKRITLINGIKNGTQSKIIVQDPSDVDTFIDVSHNEKTGIEFTYNLWMNIKSSNFKIQNSKKDGHISNIIKIVENKTIDPKSIEIDNTEFNKKIIKKKNL